MGWEKHDLIITYETPLTSLRDKINGYIQKYSNYSFTTKTKGSVHTLKLDDARIWYDFKDKLKIVSTHTPNILFTLDGMIRYEDDEVFRYYILDGKEQDASPKLMYEDFDEKKLK